MKLRIRLVVSLLALCCLLIEASAFAVNAVYVDNVTVLPNTTNVVIHVRITNDVPLRAVVIPLYVKQSVGSTATITSATMNFEDRLAAFPFDVTTANQYGASDGTLCGGILPGDVERQFKTVTATGTGVNRPVVAMPEGFLFVKSSNANLLPAGSDVSGSIKLTVNIGPQLGSMFIDTACIDPSSHIFFIDQLGAALTPSFYRGSITVASTIVPLTGYDAASHVTPKQSCPSWAMSKIGSPTESIAGDTLVLNGFSMSDFLYYSLIPHNFDPSGIVVSEFSMRYVHGDDGDPFKTAACWRMHRGGYGNILWIGMDEVFTWKAFDVIDGYYSGDTHSNFHTFRVEVSSDNSMRVFRDGLYIFSSSLYAAPLWGSDGIIWGNNGHGDVSSESRWKYFKYNMYNQPQCGCCAGTTGNVNMAGIVDLADLSALVSFLTGGGYVLPCSAEANVNAAGIVDLSDLSALTSYLTGGGYVLPSCP